jgi:translation initiation factor IF-3
MQGYFIDYPKYAALGQQFSKENDESAKLSVMKRQTIRITIYTNDTQCKIYR